MLEMTVTNDQSCVYCKGDVGPHVRLAHALRCRGCGAVVSVPHAPLCAAPSTVRLDELTPDGLLAGKYRLIRLLRDAAPTRSLLAEHVYLNHPCMVKLVTMRAKLAPSVVKSLRDEIERGYRMIDRHVVRLLDCDTLDATWYFVSEWIDGLPLDAILKLQLVLPWQQLVRVGLDAARGLTAIHAGSVSHDGIKPSNLILGADGHVRISDVGVERIREACRECPDMRSLPGLGDPYAAPELARPDGQRSVASDLYGLGVTLYQLAIGSGPTAGVRPVRRLLDQHFGRVTWPADAAERLPTAFRDLVSAMMRPSPAERPASAEQVARALAESSGVPDGTSAIFYIDDPAPRGIGVLPFAARSGSTGDDWVGYALATGVARRLAELPDTYVTDVDGLIATLKRVAGDAPADAEGILAAGRLAGAATVLTGRVHRNGDRLRITLEVLREGAKPAVIGSVAGAIERLPQLEQEAARHFARALGVRPRVRPGFSETSFAPIPAARERLVRGRQHYLNSDYQAAIALAQEAVALDSEYAEAVGFLGVCFARVGRFAEAEQHHLKHLALAAQRQDDRQAMEALANLGVMHYFRGDFAEAEKHYRRAADLARDLGLPVDHAHISNNLGFVLLRCMRLEDAETAFRAAIETHRAYGALAALVGPYSGIGNVLSEQRRYAEARTYYRRALALAAETGDRTSVGTTHMHLGRCAALEGRFEDAKREYAVAIGLLEDTGFWTGLARACEFMIDLNVVLGALDEAIRCADMRLSIARRSHSAALESSALRQKAELLAKAGRSDDARRCLEAQPSVAGAA